MTRAKLITIALCIAVAALLFWVGRNEFQKIQERRLVAAATAFLNKGDLRSASLSARQALQINPRDVQACEIMAQIGVTLHLPDAILWRQKIAELQPGNTQQLLELATVALKFNETFIAQQALDQVPPAERGTVKYHEAQAALAMALNQPGVAESHFQQALLLEPKNSSLQLNIATLHMLSGKPEIVAAARAEVERLGNDPALHQQSLRTLLADARRSGDAARAMQLAIQLGASKDAAFDDCLLFLEELQHAKNPAFDSELQKLEAVAAQKPASVYVLMTWLNAHGLPDTTLAWAKTLPADIRTQMPIPLALSEACMKTGDRTQLRTLTEHDDWGALEFLRLAFRARSFDDGTPHRAGSELQQTWLRALIAAHGNPNSLVVLARFAEGVGWNDEAAQAWWLIARHDAGQRDAFKALIRIYTAQRNTAELYRVAQRIYEVEPQNPVAANNVAALALLLNKDVTQAKALSDKNFQQHPLDPGAVSTQAYSFYLQNRAKDAVDLMEKLPADALKNPTLAAYYGVFLSAAGEADKAKPFLAIAAQNKNQLLPEEEAMVQKALAQ